MSMGLVWKALVVALLTLPVMAYVTGSLVGAQTELPAERAPVVIGDPLQTEPQQTLRGRPGGPDEPRESDDPRDPGHGGASDDHSDDGVSVVRPEPRDLDDDADERDDDPDDHSGDDD
jgi:hypothetical protein